MSVNRKVRRDYPGNPSKLGMEVLKRVANRQTPRPGQEWPLSVDQAPPTGMVVARFWGGGRGGGENGLFPLVEQRCP